MKIRISLLILCVLLFSSLTLKAQNTPESVIKLTKTKLISWASSEKIVSAVKSQNAKNTPLEKIKSIDKKWTETSGLDDFMSEILNNGSSEFLKSLRKDNKYIIEAFVMDNKGANVGMTNKTSDYWQGDEDKFTKCYNNGNGAPFYGKVAFDESTQTYLIQVSVPVIDGGKTIGAVTFGIDFNNL